MKSNYSAEELARDNTPFIFFLEWSPDLPDPEFILRPLFHSGGSPNRDLFHYRNPKVDELLELQKNGLSFERRVNLFREIEKILQADTPALPLFFHKQRLAYQPYLKNLKAQPHGLLCLNLRDVWMDR